MSAFSRWAKFNFVGVMGMAVQLTALALFNRLLPGHYLCATAAAIEVTLLHNFVWHRRYTWKDRSGGATLRSQWMRFHLSNGVISMAGNLVLMRVFVRGSRLPVVVANGLAILVCSLANFCFGNHWAFPKEQPSTSVTECSPSGDSSISTA